MKRVILLASAFLLLLKNTNAQNREPDQSFGTNGVVKTQFTDTTQYNSTAVQADGKIVVAGYTRNGSNYDFLVVRYNTDGSLDNTFSGDGKDKTDFGSTNDYASSVGVQNDGKIVVAGSSNNRFALARYNTDGSLDNTFSGDGKQIDNFHGSKDGARSAAIQSDGKIVVVGVASNSFAVARYTAAGSLDNSFSGDGIQTTVFDIHLFIEQANAVAIQNNGKIVAVGSAGEKFAVARYNTDGSLDKTFSDDGRQITKAGEFSFARSVAIQKDGKIVVAGEIAAEETNGGYAIGRYNTDGSLDNTFNGDGIKRDYGFNFINSIAIQSDGKIVGGGSVQGHDETGPNFALFRFNNNGEPDSSFNGDGIQVTEISGVINGIVDIAIANDKLYVVGNSYVPGHSGIVASYLLNNPNNAPTVSISIPNNIVMYSSPARIKINAIAHDENGTISKVQFYNGTTIIHTETKSPYGFLWADVPEGNYTLTAKAFDSAGNVITSNSINVSVLDSNVAPVVSIVSPVNDTTYTGPATIRLIANAKDPNDKISKVEFYNGSTLLRTEHYYPYTYWWTNVQPGTYTITAKAYDEKGLSATSAPVTITVTNASIVSSRPSSVKQNDLNSALSLGLSPNPTRSTLQIFTKRLQLNKPSTISVISALGVVMKTVNSNTSKQTVQLDVSSLANGVYTLKVVSGGKMMYRQFVKL